VNFASPNASQTRLLQLYLSQDARAQYYRFTLDAHSRYEGMPGFSLTTVRALITAKGRDAQGKTVPSSFRQPALALNCRARQPADSLVR